MENWQKVAGVVALALVLIISDILFFSRPSGSVNAVQVMGLMDFKLERFGKNVIVEEEDVIPPSGIKAIHLEGKTLLIGDVEKIASAGIEGRADAYLVSISQLRGKDKNYTGNVSLTYTLPIFVPPGAVLSFLVLAEVHGGNITSVLGATLVSEWKNLTLRGKFVGRRKLNKYVIPFVNRTFLEQPSNVCYNYSVVNESIAYIEYFGPNYVIVEKNFTNVTQLKADLGPGIYCPPTVVITEKDLPFNGSVVYKGEIEFFDYFGSIPYVAEENNTIVEVSGLFNISGKTILDWKNVTVKEWS